MRSTLDAIASGMRNMIARGTFRSADDTQKMQTVNVDLLHDESKAEVEHWHPYGFTSVPLDGAEALVVFPGGNRSHGIVVAIGDRRVRLKGLANGEVAIHDDQGQQVTFKRDKTIVKSSKPIELDSAVKVIVIAPQIHLGGEGGPAVARVGDPTTDGATISGGSSIVFAN